MPAVKYHRGEMVMGRWPGSSLYYEVNVLGFDSESELYTVIYKDGTELELREQDIKSTAGFQPRSRSRSRSPGRRRSRSRSPSRSNRVSRKTTAPSSPRESKRKDVEEKVVPSVGAPPELSHSGHPTDRGNECKEQPVEQTESVSVRQCERVSSLFSSPVVVSQEPDADVESTHDRNQNRYNLRRRKDDGDSKKLERQRLPEKDGNNKKTESSAVPSTPLDFGGKVGAFFWLLFLPAWVLFLVVQVNLEDPSLANFTPTLPLLQDLWDPQAFVLVVLWILFQAVLYVLPVGKLSEGMPLRTGERLKYRTNGFFALVVSALAMAAAVHQGVDLTYIHNHFLQLAMAAFVVSVLLSCYCYVRSRSAAPEQLALGGNSGHLAYDFFKGHELNPRIKDFDLKFFCEMRPGLIGWCLINFAMALTEMKRQHLDAPSCSMMLVNLFQLLYVSDGLWNEEAILTTMDLMHDGFGFMLAFGDLVWVPFTYTLQAVYLVDHPNPLSPPLAAAIVLLKVVGFYIFRKSNSEKNTFRKNPSDPNLSRVTTIPTATGKSLLVSGWWAVVRHPNYLGDLIMALAWSLPCGFSHLLPWYYMIYFIILLVHRESRDMSECRRKYGSAWDEYCQRVPYRIVPYVY